jgi:hypothetical protein
MKKIFFMLLLIFFAGRLTISAQTEKGDWFINGLNILSFQTGTVKASGDYGISKTNITEISYGPSFLYGGLNLVNSPTINYCIDKDLNVGIFLNLIVDLEKSENDNKSAISVFAIGPTVRYYIADKNKFLPFLEGKIGFGSANAKDGSTSTSKSGLFAWYLGTGGTYFFNTKIGLDINFGYQHMVSKDKDSQQNSKSIISTLNLGIGMLVGL